MYEKEFEVMGECARVASRIAKEHYDKGLSAKIKQDGSPVTKADMEIQAAVKRIILDNFPQDIVKAEEAEWTAEKGGRVWLVDPLDGTIDFIEKNGEFATCIAFLENDMPVVSMVVAPVLNKTYHAIKEEGAFLNDKRIKVSQVEDVQASRLVGSRHMKDRTKGVRSRFLSIITQGSTALRICIVAEGKAEAYIYNNTSNPKLHEWDVCAGQLILEEAGGKLTDVSGDAIPYNKKNSLVTSGVVATNGIIHEKLLEIVR